MSSFVRTPQTGRIRSFFIKDILEHDCSPAQPASQSPARGLDSSHAVDQRNHRASSARSYTVQNLLGTSDRRDEADHCISGCCECSSVYSYKTVSTPLYHPYLYSLYRQQGSWRNTLKGGVAYVSPQSTMSMYSPPKQRKPRRPWTRAVFSNLQRKGLEKRFQVQKYLTKGDRHQLASMLGLSDNQVKVWFQNRRMKWRQEEQGQDEPTQSEKQSDAQSQSDAITTGTATSNNESFRKD